MKAFTYIILLLICTSCTKSKTIVSPNKTEEIELDFSMSLAPTIVYKTKNSYNNLVPVMLNDEKTEIIAYPSQADLLINGELKTPILLNDNYLLDVKGININVAFLSLSYQEYVALETIPSLKEMFNLIIDKNPLIELCDCGNRSAFSNIENQINYLIDNKQLRQKCKVLK
jgi:hypothetical protein